MKILGVDVGLTGACAVVELRADGLHVLAVTDMPIVGVGARRRVDAIALQEWLLETGPRSLSGIPSPGRGIGLPLCPRRRRGRRRHRGLRYLDRVCLACALEARLSP